MRKRSVILIGSVCVIAGIVVLMQVKSTGVRSFAEHCHERLAAGNHDELAQITHVDDLTAFKIAAEASYDLRFGFEKSWQEELFGSRKSLKDASPASVYASYTRWISKDLASDFDGKGFRPKFWIDEIHREGENSWHIIQGVDDATDIRAIPPIMTITRTEEGYRLRIPDSVMKTIEPTSKRSEQDGARQPTTALDSKSEGNMKPKPESEVRSQ